MAKKQAEDIDIFVKKIQIEDGDFYMSAEGYEAADIVQIMQGVKPVIIKAEKIEFLKEQEIKPVSISRDSNNEIVEEYNLKDITRDAKLPRLSSEFKCASCGQSILFINPKDNSLVIRDIFRNKLYGVPVDISTLPEIEKSNVDNIIDIYNDLYKYANKNEPLTLVSNSEDIIVCPICKEENTIKDTVKTYEDSINENLCPVCGGEIETVISQSGEERRCKDNNCLSKIKH